VTNLRDQLQASLGAAYTIERELGGGGMSRVLVARETALRRDVVVKVLPPELVAGVNVERFRREILLAAGLQHPHIVPVLSAGDMQGLPWFTMPFVQGESLRQRLARGPMPIGEVLSVLRDVARALSYAHERSVVHRDIKPDNVLLSSGSAVVTDFGIAKALSESRTSENPDTTHGGSLTQIGTSIGTPSYMAPEQAAGDPDSDARADLYSFGCLAYEMLAGHPPFVGKTPQKLLAAHMAERPRNIVELRADTPPLLAEMVMRCLEKDAADRPQSATDLVKVLDLAMTTSGSAHSAAPSVLLGGRVRMGVALAWWAGAFVATWILAKAAIVGIGLPDWVLPGAMIVMLLGLPMILFTAYVQRTAHRAFTRTPTLTPGGSPVPQGTMATLALKAVPHVSWRRTMRGGIAAFGVFVLLIVAFMAMRAFGIGPAASLFAAGKLNERDKIVVSEFNVARGDSALAPVVTEAVRTSLGQSRALTVASPASIAGALQRMQKPTSSHLDVALAREVAVREGAKAVVSGDITPLGAGFVVTMRLVSADSGAMLASFHETADSPKDLLPTLDKLVRALREKAGESLKYVQASAPLEQVTTASLEALRKYAEGARAHDVEGDFDKAVGLLRQAIALDTTFAMAYRKLTAALNNAGYGRTPVTAAYKQAYKYRDRLTERERIYLDGHYFSGGPGHDRARGAAAFETLLSKYPKDVPSLITLGRIYMSRGEFARADTLFRKARALDPGNGITLANQVIILQHLGRPREAWDTIGAVGRRSAATREALGDRVIEAAWTNGWIDTTAAELRKAQASRLQPIRIAATYASATLSQTQGRLREADRLFTSARAADSARGVEQIPHFDSLRLANNDVLFLGQNARALLRLNAMLAARPLQSLPENEARPDMAIAVGYARTGKVDRARAILSQWDVGTRDTSLKRWMAPQRHEVLAEIALAEARPKVAVDEFRLAAQRPDGLVEWCYPCYRAQTGLAFDRAAMPDSAIAEFEYYLAASSNTKLLSDQDYLAAIYKRLGELYEAKGNTAKAITYTQKFVDLWKNADPELQPKVIEARQRLARLNKIEPR